MRLNRFTMTTLTTIAAIAWVALPAFAETLKTQNFRVTITRNCPEGYVACNDVTYDGRDLNTGASIHLKGKTLHTTCADRVTPCRFIGYEFRNRDYRYVVTDSGSLLVYQGTKLLLDERGTWDYRN